MNNENIVEIWGTGKPIREWLYVQDGANALVKSLNLKKGDEILTTSNTWISSAYAIALNNCKPVFIDVNKDNFQMDIDLRQLNLSYQCHAQQQQTYDRTYRA